jgi:glycosyltransferase involved in cell wall biosynthesis
MAEGLPCISSPTCGIPEILDMDFLCQYDDWAGFAEKIVQFLDHPEWMQRESGRNLETARRFSSSVLNGRRKAFYERLRVVATDHP